MDKEHLKLAARATPAEDLATENAILRARLDRLGEVESNAARTAWLAEHDRLRKRIAQLEALLTANPS